MERTEQELIEHLHAIINYCNEKDGRCKKCKFYEDEYKSCSIGFPFEWVIDDD